MNPFAVKLLAGFAAVLSLHAHSAPAGSDVATLRTNSLGMRFVAVPGSAAWFSIWETRVRDYRVFAEATGRPVIAPDFVQSPDHPVVNVSWEDAAAFCQWLTLREREAGVLTAEQEYRLPTDAEWSDAAGLGPEQGRLPEERFESVVVWPWGSQWPPKPGDGNYAPELEVDVFPHTAPVGSFRPNRRGLLDLGGNVWEWCEDWYNDTRVTKTLRGGSYHDAQPKDLLAAYRFSGTVHLSNDDIGFRVVLAPVPAPRAPGAIRRG